MMNYLPDNKWAKLVQACRELPPAVNTYDDYPDYVTNLILTVMDLQLKNVIVSNAIVFYRKERWDEVRTLDDLEAVLARYPDTKEGNRAACKYLLGYNYGERLGRLRRLAVWARLHGVTDQEALRTWAHGSNYYKDWRGQIRGLDIAAYKWLVMRLGVDTMKPDLWLHSFVRRVLGHDLNDFVLVEVLTNVAHHIDLTARQLDARIWEHERGEPGSI
jgi:hypothetical protein